MGKKVVKSGQETVDLSTSHEERSDLACILQTFSTSASMHGLSKIKDVQYMPLRIIWILATLICSGCLIWQICMQVDLFNQHNKKTLLTENYNPIKFPDVTICNHRHIDIDILYSLFSQYHLNDGNMSPTELYQMKNLSRARHDLEIEFMRYQSSYGKTFRKYLKDHFRLITQALLRTIIWSGLNLTFSGMNTLVAPLEELVTVCNWGDKECSLENKETKDNYFRKCLTLKPPEKTIREGIENGLSVISLVGSGMLPFSDIIKNYTVLIPGLSENGHPLAGTDGLRVVVHPRGTPPLPMTEGFTIPPGYMGSLGIKVKRYKRMAAPYGNCIQTDPYSSDPNGGYCMSVCLKRCIQNHTVEDCGCSNPTLPIDTNYSHRDPSCDYFQPVPDNCQGDDPPIHCLSPFETLSRNLNCANRVKEQIQERDDITTYCGCYPACSEDAYNIGFSLGAWPSLMETDIIWYSELGPKIQHLISTLNYSDVKKQLFMDHFTTSNRYKAMQDFVKLDVYLSDAAVQETTEEEDYLLVNLVADIGGTMGLWVGMSILSLMEVVQLLLDILITFCTQKRKGHNIGVAVNK